MFIKSNGGNQNYLKFTILKRSALEKKCHFYVKHFYSYKLIDLVNVWQTMKIEIKFLDNGSVSFHVQQFRYVLLIIFQRATDELLHCSWLQDSVPHLWVQQ